MSELSDEASESELLDRSLSMWHGLGQAAGHQELDVPLDLHTAASIGQQEVVQACIQCGSLDLNRRNRGGWTALMYASYIGHGAIVQLLLEAGANLNVPTPEGQTPLMLASSCGNEKVADLLLQQGAELEMKDIHGWTALFHCTSAGHQQMVKFLLDNGANANCREPLCGYTPLMEAAASGHEIIVQYLLNHGVRVDMRDNTGATARTLAMQYRYTKIVGLIDLHMAPVPKVLCRGPGKYEDLSSSDESYSAPQRQRPARKSKGPSIHEGPHALAKITAVRIGGRSRSHYEQVPPEGYVTFSDEGSGTEGGDLRYRDVTSPINDHDVESSSSREDNSSFANNLAAIRTTSGSSSSESLPKAVGIGSEGSMESNEDSDHAAKLSQWKHAKSSARAKNHDGDSRRPHRPRVSSQPCAPPKLEAPPYTGPQDLAAFLEQIGCLKYLPVFEEQDVDLRIFLTLTESDLKEIGITLFGPKRKMTSAIARWHSSARPPSDALELAYADRLEAEMQELAIQLHKRCEEVEALKGQVSQEQELRAVAESCLMERDVAWSETQAKLREMQAVSWKAGTLLEHMQACQAELSSRLAQEHAAGRLMEVKAPVGADPAEWPSTLKALSVPELSTLLEKHVGEMGTALHSVSQNLERLQSPPKGKAPRKQP
uniref:ankyrin repeat and SAM domain-containing protein 3 n=1 Tax=Euleptes europaea TaxID=460621 RepID=UPI00253F792C|nr:ankyrin repeat and SAM domain-containing protein 3 [Euleptes europaea]